MLVDWLMDNAGPVIRYRTARELMASNADTGESTRLLDDLLAMPEATACIANVGVGDPHRHNGIHGSFDTCLENAMARAINLGLHRGIPALDTAVAPWIEYVRADAARTPNPRECFGSIIMSGLLLKAGYDDGIVSFMLGSLRDLSGFTDIRDYAIYMVDTSGLTGMPANFKGKPVLRQDLHQERGYLYPLIHDIVGLSGLYALHDPAVDRMVSSVITYILTPEFHDTVADGYGVLVSGPKKYHGMGWDPKVPGFHGIDDRTRANGNRLLYRMLQYAPYPDATRTQWFADALEYLEGFRTERGTYAFPAAHMPEKAGYAVMGYHMGLGENRRSRKALEVESTFLMLKLKSLAGLA